MLYERNDGTRGYVIKIATTVIIIPCLFMAFPLYAALCEVDVTGLLFPFYR